MEPEARARARLDVEPEDEPLDVDPENIYGSDSMRQSVEEDRK